MSRFKDRTFNLSNSSGEIASWSAAQLAALYDIRDELKRLNDLLYCRSFIEIPAILRAVKRNTTKKRAKAKKPEVAR